MTDPLKTAQADARAETTDTPAPLGTVSVGVDTFPILRKPPTLLLSELARTGSGEPDSMAVFAEFFEVTLGTETYRRFKRAVYAAADPDETLGAALAEVVEKTLGRPTE